VQTFPDGYVFHGSWTEAMRQLGNAVPVLLAQKVATSVAEELISSELQELAAKVGRNPFGATPSNTTKPRRFA
jgi:DNA (cytosine-5)-methyltransferase 1